MNTYLVTHQGPSTGHVYYKDFVPAISAQDAADKTKQLHPNNTIERIYLLTDMQGEWK